MRKMFFLALVLYAVPAAAVEMGGYGVGNGGDGLELANVSALRDVVVPIPGEVSEAGLLEVVGTPGSHQQDFVHIRFVPTDQAGRPLFGALAGRSYQRVRLNAPVMLAPGTYDLFNGVSASLIEVQANQKTVIELRKIQIPPSSRAMEAVVVQDLTDASMQDLYLRTLSANWDKGQHCGRQANTAACQAVASGDYLRLRGVLVCFGVQGDLFIWDMGRSKWETHGLNEVGLMPGEFVSVFPGVYAITFTDTQTGQTKTVRGIDVR